MRKNDVTTADTSIECKTTRHLSFSLKLAELIKAEFNAAVENRDMVFKVTFEQTGVIPLSYIILPEEDYLRMREQLGTQTQSGTTGRLAES